MEQSAAPTQAPRTARTERLFVVERCSLRWGIGNGKRRHASCRRGPGLDEERLGGSGSAESDGLGDQQGCEGRRGGGGNAGSHDGRRDSVGAGTATSPRATESRVARERGADSAGVASHARLRDRRGKPSDAESTSEECEEDVLLVKHTTSHPASRLNIEGLSLRPRGPLRPPRGHKVGRSRPPLREQRWLLGETPHPPLTHIHPLISFFSFCICASSFRHVLAAAFWRKLGCVAMLCARLVSSLY
ncbi:hypothetical protein T484DRAFT_2731866 [Baffinella frigidus]|nr:hypothetical protein T484DRAFT_2731866 [Cryptophyta sp. CCMP2293]